MLFILQFEKFWGEKLTSWWAGPFGHFMAESVCCRLGSGCLKTTKDIYPSWRDKPKGAINLDHPINVYTGHSLSHSIKTRQEFWCFLYAANGESCLVQKQDWHCDPEAVAVVCFFTVWILDHIYHLPLSAPTANLHNSHAIRRCSVCPKRLQHRLVRCLLTSFWQD